MGLKQQKVVFGHRNCHLLQSKGCDPAQVVDNQMGSHIRHRKSCQIHQNYMNWLGFRSHCSMRLVVGKMGVVNRSHLVQSFGMMMIRRID